MFQFPGFALIPLWIQRISPFIYDLLPVNRSEPRMASSQWSRPHSPFAISQFANPSTDNRSQKVGFPIRKFTDQSLFAAPHDLSQRTTSFIASQRQGIHRIPLRHLIALIARTRFRACAQNVPTIRKDQFCFKRIRDPSGQAPDHDWYARGPDERDRTKTRKGHRVLTVFILKGPPCRQTLVAPSGLDRMRFLFTMSKDRKNPNPGNFRSRQGLSQREKTDPIRDGPSSPFTSRQTGAS